MSTVVQLATVISLIGFTAALLAGVGIVGLVGYAVTQRAREMAIRLALGAPRSQVLAAVLRQFAAPALIGLIAGVGIAAAFSRLLRRALYGVSNLDPAGYAGAVMVMIGIVGVAAVLPATRALRANLAHLLHHE